MFSFVTFAFRTGAGFGVEKGREEMRKGKEMGERVNATYATDCVVWRRIATA